MTQRFGPLLAAARTPPGACGPELDAARDWAFNRDSACGSSGACGSHAVAAGEAALALGAAARWQAAAPSQPSGAPRCNAAAGAMGSGVRAGGGGLAPLVCVRLQVDCRVVGGVELGAFAGSTLRGGFGHALKRMVCTWPVGDCPRCCQRRDCLYTQVFESAPAPESERLRGIDQVPRAYVLEPPGLASGWREMLQAARAQALQVQGARAHGVGARGERLYFKHGEAMSFGLVLVGRAAEWSRLLLMSLAELGRSGLGWRRGRYVIERVTGHAPGEPHQVQAVFARQWAGDVAGGMWQDPPLGPAAAWAPAEWRGARRVHVRFCTPTRVCSGGRVVRAPEFVELVRALLRRLSSLAYFHCGGALELDFAGLVAGARGVRTRSQEVAWWQQSRFSRRQEQRVDMSGLVGSICYEAESAEALAPYLELLAAGTWLHVGKGAVMGLGRYQVDVER